MCVNKVKKYFAAVVPGSAVSKRVKHADSNILGISIHVLDSVARVVVVIH